MPWQLKVREPNPDSDRDHAHTATLDVDQWDEALISKGQMAKVCDRDFICDICGNTFRAPFGSMVRRE